MSKPAFTPGPWVAHFSTRSIDVRGNNWKEADGVEYRPLIVTLHGYRDWAECCANTHLISAAPDMYEALKALVDEFGIRDYDCDENDDLLPAEEQSAVVKAAMIALAKAEGRS